MGNQQNRNERYEALAAGAAAEKARQKHRLDRAPEMPSKKTSTG